MTLPHFESISDVPDHLTTRSGLKQRGFDGLRPEAVATVMQFGKVVFLYDLHAQMKGLGPVGAGLSRRVRAQYPTSLGKKS